MSAHRSPFVPGFLEAETQHTELQCSMATGKLNVIS